MAFRIPVWFLRVLWTTGIIVFLLISVIPLGRTPLSDVESGDKIAHFGVFFILALFPVITRAVSKRMVFLLLLLVALGSETLQIFVPYRSAEATDIAADILGLFAGLGSCFVLRHCLYLLIQSRDSKRL